MIELSYDKLPVYFIVENIVKWRSFSGGRTIIQTTDGKETIVDNESSEVRRIIKQSKQFHG